MPLAADNNFYLRLIVEKMHVFALFSNEYSRPYHCSNILRLWLTFYGYGELALEMRRHSEDRKGSGIGLQFAAGFKFCNAASG